MRKTITRILQGQSFLGEIKFNLCVIIFLQKLQSSRDMCTREPDRMYGGWGRCNWSDSGLHIQGNGGGKTANLHTDFSRHWCVPIKNIFPGVKVKGHLFILPVQKFDFWRILVFDSKGLLVRSLIQSVLCPWNVIRGYLVFVLFVCLWKKLT